MICSLFTDLKPLNESISKLKAIELRDPPVETMLSAMSGQVEELRLTVDRVCYKGVQKPMAFKNGERIGAGPC